MGFPPDCVLFLLGTRHVWSGGIERGLSMCSPAILMRTLGVEGLDCCSDLSTRHLALVKSLTRRSISGSLDLAAS